MLNLGQNFGVHRGIGDCELRAVAQNSQEDLEQKGRGKIVRKVVANYKRTREQQSGVFCRAKCGL